MNYSQVKKLDEDTQRHLKEGSGPVDECLCNLLAPPYEPKGFRGSIKKAFASIGGRRPVGANGGPGRGTGGAGGNSGAAGGQNSVDIPLTFSKGGKGIYTTREQVKRTSSCGKCGCDNENFVLKHSYANIRITSPDVSSICPCPSSACMPGKDKLNNNIKVTIEHVSLSDNDAEDYEKRVKKNIIEDRLPKEKITQNDASAKELVEFVWKKWDNKEDIEGEQEWNQNIEKDRKYFQNKIVNNGALQTKSLNNLEELEIVLK